MPDEPLAEVAATITVTEPPSVSMIHFWALQTSFMVGETKVGAGHFGLQFHPDYPGDGAVNWGGYATSGDQLEGSTSDLPSARSNINTRNYDWEPNRPYKYRIYQAPGSRYDWRGSVTDMVSGVETVVRDLHVQADSLRHPMVWSEVFAHCDHPSHAVRWSDFEALSVAGDIIRPASVKLSYQTFEKGGCGNTNILPGAIAGSVVQRTNTARTNVAGSHLVL